MIALRDPDVDTRSDAAEAVGNYGNQAGYARSALSESLHDPDAGVRSVARSALEKIGGREVFPQRQP